VQQQPHLRRRIMRMRVGVSIICGGRWVEHSAEGRWGGAV